MTTLEALQSLIEYSNTNLFAKALADHGLTGAETYDSSYTSAVELAAADVCDSLLAHPDLTEGGLSIRYDKGALLALRDGLRAKHGVSGGQTIDGSRIW